MLKQKIRLARRSDLAAIVAIYNAAIPGRQATADLEMISVASRRKWFATHTPRTYPIIVADAGGGISGWAALNPFYGRPGYRFTCEVAVYVAPAFFRCGVGQRLTDELIRRAGALRKKTLLAFIFAHNRPSIRLFKSRGFARWGHLPAIADMAEAGERDLAIYGLKI